MPRTLFLSLLALTLFLGCTKKKKDTSPYTSSEYFTCLVNGEEWVAQSPGGPNNPAAVSAEYDESADAITIFGVLKNQSRFERIGISAIGISQTGPHNLAFQQMQTYGFINYYPSNCGIYYYDTNLVSSINILSFNSDSHRVEGTFSLKIRNPDCPDTVMTITNGHFSTSFQ